MTHAQLALGVVISIHALVKRATLCLCVICVIVLYFNPRPREEGDTCLCVICVIVLYFNPRPREEGDGGGTISPPLIIISIHALVKRATTCLCVICVIVLYFNPRPREEGDSLQQCFLRLNRIFQSTPS